MTKQHSLLSGKIRLRFEVLNIFEIKWLFKDGCLIKKIKMYGKKYLENFRVHLTNVIHLQVDNEAARLLSYRTLGTRMSQVDDILKRKVRNEIEHAAWRTNLHVAK